jgi:hypothetical protein
MTPSTKVAALAAALLLAACGGPAPAGPTLGLRAKGMKLGDAGVVEGLARVGYGLPAAPNSTNLRGAWRSYEPHDVGVETHGDVVVVVDRTTGLMWQATGSYKYASSGLVKAADVASYVSGLNSGRHAGFSDWRVPTLEELASVVGKEKREASWSLVEGFDLGAPWYALTTDGVQGDDSAVWTIDLGAGDLQKYSSTDEYYLLLVRTMK